MVKDEMSETTHWALTRPAFSQLLQWLDPDRNRTGEQYERLRQKLRLFFEHRGCQSPEDLTDKTLDRVARKLASGEEIQAADPASYCYGVAHNILKEYWRDPAREALPLDSPPHNRNPQLTAAETRKAEDDPRETGINSSSSSTPQATARLTPKRLAT